MRIDHTPTQALLPHRPPHHVIGGDFPGVAKHVMIPKESSYRLVQPETEDSGTTNRDMCPMRIGSKVDGFERKGQAWFVATELQSDLVVEVGDMSFHLHKFPLLSRSGKLNRLVFDSRDTENSHIKLDDMPGGPETFELAAKFCYGVAVELTAANVAALRCAAEYLEMTEDLDEGNLVCKTEAYLSFVVLASWKDSIAVLQSCEKLLPWAEQLQIVRRCCESVAWKACTDPRGIRWSYTERAELKKPIHASPLWNGPKGHQQGGDMISDQVPSDWWVEDICVVCVSFFTKIIQAIKAKGMRYDLIGSAVVHYAIKWLPGITREFAVTESKDGKDSAMGDGNFIVFGGHSPHATAAIKDKDHFRTSDSTVATVPVRNRELIETLSGIIPTQKDAVPCTFLLRLIRVARMVSVTPVVITDLEKRAGLQLDQGTLSDLLIPSFDHACETLFDVDLVQRMLDYFLLQDSISSPGTVSPVESEKEKFALNSTVDKIQVAPHSTYPAKMRVAKLIDNYLAEVGRDQNLTLHKFLALAEALPENTRVTDDGLYKAIDTYLKAHPVLSENDRKKLCRTLDCQRLSLDACMHAAQNERLPLRVVVQVLFGEQIKLRNAVTGTTSISKDQSGPYPPEDDQISIGESSHDSIHHDQDQEHSEEEIKVLRSDVERMKGKFMALQHDYTAIQLQLEKLTKNPKPPLSATGGKKKKHPHFPHFLTHPMDLFHHPMDLFHIHHHHHGHGHESDATNPEKDHSNHAVKVHDSHNHHHGGHNSKHGSHQKDHGDREFHAKDHHESHGKDHHDSQAKDYHESHLKDHHHHTRHSKENESQHRAKDGHRNSRNGQQRHLPPRDASAYTLTISKQSEFPGQPTYNNRPSSKANSCHSKDSLHQSPNGVQSQEAAPLHSKLETEFHHSGSQPDSGEDSSRSLEGPATPTHMAEHHNKFTGPFAFAMRKWRNSIS